MGIGSLRQGAKKFTENSSKGGKGGKGGFFNKLRIPQLTPQLQGMLRPNESPGEPIVLVRPEPLYDDIYDVDDHGNWKGTKTEALHFVQHQVKRIENGKEKYGDFPCSAGPSPHAPQNCVGCQQNDAGNKTVGNGRQQWAFNVKHLVPYHEIPLVDKKTGQMRMKQDNSGPVMVLQQCQVGTPSERLYGMKNNRNGQCEHCQRNMPLLYGAPKFLQLGKNHLEELFKVDTFLEQTCANCMTRLIKVAFDCARCGNEILNVAQSGFVNDQLKQFAETPQQCRSCGHVGLAKPAYECGFDPNGMYKVPQGGCSQNVEPRPMSIFDCVLFVHKEGQDTQTKLVISPPTPIRFFRTHTGNTDLEQFLQQPHLVRGINLVDAFKPIDLEEQARICGVPNPFAPQQQQQYQNYPGQQGVAPGQYAPPPQQYGGQMPPQQPQYGAPQPPPYGAPVPGYPPPQQQPFQNNGPLPAQSGAGNMQYPQQQPPGMPFGGRPNFGKQ